MQLSKTPGEIRCLSRSALRGLSLRSLPFELAGRPAEVISSCNLQKFIIIAAVNESLLQNIRFVHGIPAERLCECAIMIISPFSFFTA